MSDIAAVLAALHETAGSDEALFRCSNIERIMLCPGSVRLNATLPKVQDITRYNTEGSAAHFIAASVLRGESELTDWVGQLVEYEPGLPTVYFDREMIEAIRVYIDIGLSFATPGCEQLVEEKVSLGALDPDDPLLAENKGTTDWCLVNWDERWLHTVDLKFGKGKKVNPESPQLKNYALNTLYRFPHPVGWEKVSITVVQPRIAEAMPPVTKTFTPDELMFDFQGELLSAMLAALDEAAPRIPGEHCRNLFCPAARQYKCPEAENRGMHAGNPAAHRSFKPGEGFPPLPTEIFQGTPSQPVPMTNAPLNGERIVLPEAASRSAEEISAILALEDVYKAWWGGVKHRAKTLASLGNVIEGHELVQRSGPRVFKDLESAVNKLRELGLQTGDIYDMEPRVHSPAHLEKLVAPHLRKYFDPDAQESLVQQEKGEVLLVKVGSGKKPIEPIYGKVDEAD